ncbi:JAB domain-containing protein [Gracilimonas sediminicola]|uniref:JAB domain-containing protein n=1 Tax=Gracilimonas sediminicola TaxID=2952158 RepID=UPI0038D4D1FC
MKPPNNITLSDGVPYCKIQYSVEPDIEHLPQITSDEQAYAFLMEVWDQDAISYKEEFAVIMLNQAKKVLGWAKTSSGGSSSTVVDPSMIFQVALLAHADSIILVHNHPSGNLKPSNADINLTKRIRDAGKLLGIQVIDHLIITPSAYTSFMDQGLL